MIDMIKVAILKKEIDNMFQSFRPFCHDSYQKFKTYTRIKII